MDDFFPAGLKRLQMLGNRGANGIDGVISSALGAAAGAKTRVTILLGDLTFVHDLGGLLAAKKFCLDATVVIVNNDGGGIFSYLPQAQLTESFEPYFGTPTGLDLAHAAALFDGHFERVATEEGLASALSASWNRSGLTVIDATVKRAEAAAEHQRIWQAATEAAEAAIGA
jgi:2-succinyl-5-enolpyruvyl-6-hydroxy-3-cyclohexene-1-carboxylate synthase